MPSTSALWMVIVGLIVFGLILFFIGPQLGWKIEVVKIGQKESQKTVTGPTAPPTQVFKGDAVRIISKGGEPFNQAEIGCAVAQDMVNDFVQYGTRGTRTTCEIDSCLAAYRNFSLKQEKASGDQEKKLSNFNCAACDPLLDETCVSKNLAKQIISETPFCNHFIVSVNGESLITGNNKCDANFNSATDTCADICPGGDIVASWMADNVSDKIVSDGFDDRYVNLNANTQLLDGKPYAYTLNWKPSKKAYELEFLRIPETFDAGTFNGDKLAGYVSLALWTNTRSSAAGRWKSELRRVADFTFSVDEDVFITDFAGKLKELTQASKLSYKDCNKENCAEGEVVKTIISPVDPPKIDPINLNSNIGEDGKIVPGKTYRAVVNKWKIRAPGSFNFYTDFSVALIEV